MTNLNAVKNNLFMILLSSQDSSDINLNGRPEFTKTGYFYPKSTFIMFSFDILETLLHA